jgi:hypothetical protein
MRRETETRRSFLDGRPRFPPCWWMSPAGPLPVDETDLEGQLDCRTADWCRLMPPYVPGCPWPWPASGVQPELAIGTEARAPR